MLPLSFSESMLNEKKLYVKKCYYTVTYIIYYVNYNIKSI